MKPTKEPSNYNNSLEKGTINDSITPRENNLQMHSLIKRTQTTKSPNKLSMASHQLQFESGLFKDKVKEKRFHSSSEESSQEDNEKTPKFQKFIQSLK